MSWDDIILKIKSTLCKTDFLRFKVLIDLLDENKDYFFDAMGCLFTTEEALGIAVYSDEKDGIVLIELMRLLDGAILKMSVEEEHMEYLKMSEKGLRVYYCAFDKIKED